MKRLLLLVGAIVALGASLARAQSRTIVVQPSDADNATTGAVITWPTADGGCTLTPLMSASPVPGAHAATHDFGGNRCNVVTAATERAAELDMGVGDGGVP